MSEIWKEVECNKRYQVSSFGRIKGIHKILNPATGNHGFKIVMICSENGRRNTYLLHRLIAIAFIPNPNHFLDVDHLNFDKSDNRIENLEWTNDYVNNNRLYDAGRMHGNFSSAGKIRCIESGIIFNSMLECCESMSLPYSSLNYYIHGKMNNVKGFHFELALSEI